MGSSGQDNVIRLWRITFTETVGSSQNDISSLSSIVKFVTTKYIAEFKLEAVLYGHEDWVVSITWHPHSLQLLSASADKSLIVWEQSSDKSGLWLEKARVGEVGGQASGYNGGCYSADGLTILAVSYFGGFYAWRCEEKEPALFKPCTVFTGHSMGVCDLDWDPSGTYLLSCSLDQTTRCFAPTLKGGYAEVARPQVHGHDFSCVAFLSSSCYISGSEEKILRVFRAPLLFAESLSKISGFPIAKVFPNPSLLAEGGALLPALGLSNKQLENGSSLSSSEASKENFNVFVAPSVLTDLPTEDRLMQSTLWPEQQKLYGHGFEVYSVAVNYSGTQVASASKASQQEHAAIILWDTTTWKNRTTLTAHRLTVAQMEFSHDDHMLASVSRDRTFAIFIRSADDPWSWSLMYQSNTRDDVHSRIIWSCSWTPDDKFLATCSRDKKVLPNKTSKYLFNFVEYSDN
uniref:Elongator complex protein 2 n=1 Tax=Syphacia muris TaxID=451379 RepID=A0A0N5AUM9_9BILA